jgi:hypothetical protein
VSDRIEWADAAVGFEIMPPDEVEAVSPDGNDAEDWGIGLGDSVVLYGQPAELRALLLRAHNALPPAPENVGAPRTPRDAHGVRRELRRPGR